MSTLPFPIDPGEFAVWLGTAAGLGLVVTLLLERLLWFQSQTPEQKEAIVVGTAIVLAFASVLLQWAVGIPIAWPTTPQGWLVWALRLIFQGVAAWMALQYGHSADPARIKAAYIKYGL